MSKIRKKKLKNERIGHRINTKRRDKDVEKKEVIQMEFEYFFGIIFKFF